MGYQPKHGLVQAVRRLSWRARVLAVAATAVAVAGGGAAYAAGAIAAPTLSVSLSAGTSSTAVWDSSGDPVLTAGTDAGTSAQVHIHGVHGTQAPATAPTFTSTPAPSAGDPRWVLEFHNGCYLFGDGTADHWAVNPGGLQDVTYATAVADAQACGQDDYLTAAFIVADAGNHGIAYTLTDIQYGGNTLPAGADVVTVASPGSQSSTVGTAITPLQLSASSSKGDHIASYDAHGTLPAGLHLDTSTGVISGTPTAPPGSHTVAVTATDNGGTVSNAVTFTWTVQGSGVVAPPPTIVGPGEISTFVNHASCLDNAGRLAVYQPLIIWRCGSSGGAHQQFELYTLGGRTTLRTVLNGKVMCVTTPGGTGTLVLGVCSNTAVTQTVVKQGSKYVFPGDGGRVMDLSGACVKNGTHVLAYPLKTTTTINQMWSLP